MQATAPQAAIYRPETAVVAVGTTGNEAAASAISWGAIIGGAFAAAAMGLILIALGTGLGFSALSPWSGSGASATTMTSAGAIWLLLMSAIASAIGGYLAGRLRTRWIDVHVDEVFFRDTAQGFLAWSVGTVITAAVLTSAAGEHRASDTHDRSRRSQRVLRRQPLSHRQAGPSARNGRHSERRSGAHFRQ